SADTATDWPWSAAPTAPEPTSLPPCWLQTPPLRVNTHTAPFPPSSAYPPTTEVFPSADSALDFPKDPSTPAEPVPTSLAPCCWNDAWANDVASERNRADV